MDGTGLIVLGSIITLISLVLGFVMGVMASGARDSNTKK